MNDYLLAALITTSISVSGLLSEETDSLYKNEPLLSKRTFSYASENLSSKDTSDAEGSHYRSEQPLKKLKVDLSDVVVLSGESLTDQKEKLSKVSDMREANNKAKVKKLASEKTKEGDTKALDEEFIRDRALSTDLSISDLVLVKPLDHGVGVNFEQDIEVNSNNDELWVEISSEPDYEMSQLLENLRKECERKQHNSINVDYRSFAANIPKFFLNNKLQRKGRRALKPVWNPEAVDYDFLNEYSSKLSSVLNQVIINEEKSLELLKKCGMDVDLALEQVNNEKVYFRSYLSVNQRQLRKKF